jgi:hypothetical protein
VYNDVICMHCSCVEMRNTGIAYKNIKTVYEHCRYVNSTYIMMVIDFNYNI